MPTTSEKRRSTPAATALTPDQLAEAAQVGARLAAELRLLYEQLPPHAKTGLGLARFLEVDRGTATRFVGVCVKTADGLNALAQAPGVRGLRQVLDALGRHPLPQANRSAAAAAVERFERLIQEMGGSQTKLVERITAARVLAGADPESHERTLYERRKRLFESATDLVGQRTSLSTLCQAFRPSQGKPELMDQAMLRGFFDYRARRDAPPYAIRSFGRNDQSAVLPGNQPGASEYQALDAGAGHEGPRETVFREFSTDPIPMVTTRGSGKESMFVVDTERISEHTGLDFVLGQALYNNWGHPALDDPPLHEVSTFVSVPCERLVLDVFLHRSMARQCVPSIKLYRTTPGVFHNRAAHWHDMLPYPPALQVLGPEQHPTGSRFYPRHAELLTAFFGRVGWPMHEFVAYRVEVEYPIWCGYYCVIFDYSGQ